MIGNALNAGRMLTPLALAIGLIGSALAAPGAGTSRVIVGFKDGMALQARAGLTAVGATVKVDLADMNAMAIELPTARVAELRQRKDVAYVEPDHKRFLAGKAYKGGQEIPYGITMVQANKLPDGDKLTTGMKVCIIDSGYDNTHEDLAANPVNGEYDTGTGWWYTDENHHGTHVAGTVAAINQKGVGVVGVNPNKKLNLHIVKVFGKDGDWAYSSTLVAAAKKCQAAGSNVISMSLGGPSFSATEDKAFAKLRDANILSIAAAGNGGNTAISYPAGYTSVMSVAAIDSTKAWATFSQYNADVEIAAPGVERAVHGADGHRPGWWAERHWFDGKVLCRQPAGGIARHDGAARRSRLTSVSATMSIPPCRARSA